MGIQEDIQMLQALQQGAGNQGQQGMMPPQMMQQPQGMMPQQQQRPNPLEAGSRAAVEAAKRSLEMSDSENKRALGRAIIQMMANVSNHPAYGKGLAGSLTAMSGSFPNAIQAYDQERNRIESINHMLQMQQKQEEMQARKEEREMKKMAHDMEIAQKRLGIEQGYFGLEREKHADEKKAHEELSKAGAKIPISSLKPLQWSIAQKEIQSHMEKGQAAHDTLQSIYSAKRILKDDPNITKNMSVIMLAAQRHDPSIIRQKLNSWLIPEETRVNAEMLSKHLSNIYTSKLKGFPARGMNMFLEKQLREGNVDVNMTSESILKLLDKDENAVNHIYKSAQEVYDEYEKGYFYRPRPMKIETEMTEMSDEDDKPIKSASKQERILEEIARLEEMMKTAPE